jgi:UDP-3-O-[3-hydroxymyristoyl] glucosamine N-acyltransferase
MGLTLGEIADAIGGSIEGDPGQRISRVRLVHEAEPGDICVAWDRASVAAIGSSSASAVVTRPGVRVAGCDVIRVENPKQAMFDLLELLHPRSAPPGVIEDGARVADDAVCSEGVFVAAGARVESKARLGPRVQIHANAVVGAGAEVGEDSVLHPAVIVYPGIRIGARVVIYGGAIIGSEGFGFLKTDDGRYRRIPQLGTVEIEDDVEIGAGTTIDRATLGKTIIRRGTKIDNLVQVGHNTEIGADCCIVGQAGVAGSSRIGEGTVIGAQAGVSDHVTVGPSSRIAARSGVLTDAETGGWVGTPALLAPGGLRVVALTKRLPEIYDELRSLRRRCEALERELDRRRSPDEPTR